MSNPIQDKTILLGVTGSIAAYKAADLASKLNQAGGIVETILTRSAQRFLTPLTFQSVTGRRAYTEDDLWGSEGHVTHIGLAGAADLLVIAPATANTLAKLAQGIADNLLTVAALAADCPLLIAPAMDGGMYAHPATLANLEKLRARGAILVGPAEGHLASGMRGKGRMVEPVELMGHIRLALGRGGPLANRRVVVTAGGTQEPIDPVRVITNLSSGKQGFALAQAALDLGAQVTLISAPVDQPTPIGVERLEVRTAQQMSEAVLQAVRDADALIMAAAVADFQPSNPAGDKIKRAGGIPQIRLEAAPDILAAVAEVRRKRGYPRVSVGFAAETQDLVDNASTKLESKQLELIVANDITASDAGFAVDTNRVVLLDAGGGVEELPLLGKYEVAEHVLSRVVDLLEAA